MGFNLELVVLTQVSPNSCIFPLEQSLQEARLTKWESGDVIRDTKEIIYRSKRIIAIVTYYENRDAISYLKEIALNFHLNIVINLLSIYLFNSFFIIYLFHCFSLFISLFLQYVLVFHFNFYTKFNQIHNLFELIFSIPFDEVSFRRNVRRLSVRHSM